MLILLTGSSGFLGNYIYKTLLEQGYEVHTLNKNSGTIKVDLCNTIPALNSSYDLVIHCAGRAHFNARNEKDAETFFSTNVNGTRNLLYSLQKSSIPSRFVFISSVSVYGLVSGMNINEEYPLLAKDPYGVSKIEAEKVIYSWAKKNNVKVSVLRLPLIVGENPLGNLKVMVGAIRNGYYCHIDGGKARKSMVLAKDVASQIINISNYGGTYNLTDGVNPTFFELAEAIQMKFQKKRFLNIPILPVNIFLFIVKLFGKRGTVLINKIDKIILTLTFDDSKARDIIGWKSNPALEFWKNELT